MKFLDNFLNSITMYRLVLYSLIALFLYAFVLSIFQLLTYSPVDLIVSLLVIAVTCVGFNYLLSKITKAPTNNESCYITALILFFILFPSLEVSNLVSLVVVSIVSMVSKYLLVINKKHIFNPAAISTVIVGLFTGGVTAWWGGSLELLPVLLVLGVLIVKKLKRFSMFFVFLLVSIISMSVTGAISGLTIDQIFSRLISSGVIIFLGTIMLTEPLTTPPTRKTQMVYGGLVGVLFGILSPELSLVIGNVYSILVSIKRRIILKLNERVQLAPNIYEFKFTPDGPIPFKAGQFLEWTLPMTNPDTRGNRRYFTLASSPTEKETRFTAKIIPESSSSFKKELLTLEKGAVMTGTQLAGDFLLPEKVNEKLVMIAGGIGITPFRSMIKFLLDTKQKRDTVLFYSAQTEQEFIYKDLFKEANIKTIYLTGKNFIKGVMIKKEIPDFQERIYYLSGPPAMVESYKKLIKDLGVAETNIKTDYFPGY